VRLLKQLILLGSQHGKPVERRSGNRLRRLLKMEPVLLLGLFGVVKIVPPRFIGISLLELRNGESRI
jgi:hypothetical protein